MDGVCDFRFVRAAVFHKLDDQLQGIVHGNGRVHINERIPMGANLGNQALCIQEWQALSLGQQRCFPRTFQQLLTDKDGNRVEGPEPKRMSAEDCYASQPITIQVQTGLQQIATLPGMPHAPNLPDRVVCMSGVIAEPEPTSSQRRKKRFRFNANTTRGFDKEQAAVLHSDHLRRWEARGEDSPREFDSWSDEELFDDLEEIDMDFDDDDRDERQVIPSSKRPL